MRIFSLARIGLTTSLIAWSGLLFAEGPGRVADDMGVSTPHRHAPRRRTPKKKGGTKPKPQSARDAGMRGVAPLEKATACPDAGPTAAPAPLRAQVDAATDDDDDEDDEDERDAGSTSGDTGAPRGARKRDGDSGAEAGTNDEDDEDDEDDDDEDDTAYELGLEVAAESRLVWRGIAENRGAVVQTSGWGGLYGLSVEGFASYLLNYEGPFAPMHVVGADLTTSYAFSVGDLRFGPGLALLYFPEGLSSSTTAEVSLGASYRLGDFHIVSGTNVDVSIEPGAYFGTLGFNWGRAKPPWTIKGVADIGWATGKYNHEYLGRDIAALDLVHAGASARYDLGSVVYVELHVDASRLIAPTLVRSVQEPTLMVGGAAIGLDWSVGR